MHSTRGPTDTAQQVSRHHQTTAHTNWTSRLNQPGNESKTHSIRSMTSPESSQAAFSWIVFHFGLLTGHLFRTFEKLKGASWEML
jgi:hypothetical protein